MRDGTDNSEERKKKSKQQSHHGEVMLGLGGVSEPNFKHFLPPKMVNKGVFF